MPRTAADASPRTLTVALGELASAMAGGCSEEAFFRGLLRACGASTLLLTKAFAAASNAADASVSHAADPALSHPDLGVPKWAYLRFVRDETQVLPQARPCSPCPACSRSATATAACSASAQGRWASFCTRRVNHTSAVLSAE